MALYGFDRSGHFKRSGGIADAPAGHGISLGKTVDRNAVPVDLWRKRGGGDMLCAVIDHLFIDLIGDDGKAVFHGQFTERTKRLLAVYSAGGIVGGVDQDRFCSG